MAAFLQAIREGRPSPIPFDQLVEVTRVSFAVANAAKRKSFKELSPCPGLSIFLRVSFEVVVEAAWR